MGYHCHKKEMSQELQSQFSGDKCNLRPDHPDWVPLEVCSFIFKTSQGIV